MNQTANWETIIGHADCILRLKTVIQRGRLPHALLFAGPSGIGKFLVAQTTAAAIFCNRANTPCGRCESCRSFSAGTHPDYSVVRPDGQAIKIEQIRALQGQLALAPYQSNRRVAIIERAETMTPAAANSLLKTLEEPVGAAVFILTADNRRQLLDTILSRCQTIFFQPLDDRALADELTKKGASLAQARALARVSGGSMAKAEELLSSGGLSLRDAAAQIALNRHRPMEEIWRSAQALGELKREELQELFLFLTMLFRDLLVLHSDETSILLFNPDLSRRLNAQKGQWTERELFDRLGKIAEAQKMLKANVNTRLLVERLLIQLHEE